MAGLLLWNCNSSAHDLLPALLQASTSPNSQLHPAPG